VVKSLKKKEKDRNFVQENVRANTKAEKLQLLVNVVEKNFKLKEVNIIKINITTALLNASIMLGEKKKNVNIVVKHLLVKKVTIEDFVLTSVR